MTNAVRDDAKATDLFRYDNEDLNEPATINTNLRVKFQTTRFATNSRKCVSECRSIISNKGVPDELIDEASEKITRRPRRADLVSRYSCQAG